MLRSSPDRRPTRRGSLSVELIMTLPILMIVLLALFEFSLLFFARGEVVEACRAGARKGTLSAATPDLVEYEVRRLLSPRMQNGLNVAYFPAQFPGEPATVTVRVPMQSASPDLLWPIGFSLQGKYLVAEATMAKE